MRIHGKTFSDVFKALPWAYKALVVAGSVFLLFIVFHFVYLATHARGLSEAAGPLNISALRGQGGLDPSLASDGKTRAFLAYTTIEKRQGETPGGTSVFLSASALPCKFWQPATGVFDAKGDDLLAPDGQETLTRGVWRYETPSLVHDPGDAGRAWKLFAYKYFWTGNVELAKRYGVIVYKYTSDPGQGVWSSEQWLFGAREGYPPQPYQSLVATQIGSLSPSLSTYVSYARPSVVSVGKFLVMSLSAFKAGATPESIVMLGSSDHGRTWAYLGTPLTKADAAKVGDYTHLSGASLLVEEGKIYLAAVFGDDGAAAKGPHFFRFSDLTSAALARDSKGTPVSLKHIPLLSVSPTATGGGFAAFTDACEHGILTSEQSGVSGDFQLFKTYQTPSSEE